MSDDPKSDAGDGGAARPAPERKPDPIEDVRKGLGLLFRAAKSAIETLPTAKVEDVVISGAREVGRALENVTRTLDKEIFHRPSGGSSAGAAPSSEPDAAKGAEGDKTAGAKEADKPSADAAAPRDGSGEPRGPRVE